MPAVHLVSEGEDPSLDNAVLIAVLAQAHGLPFQIVPAGGGNNPKAIRAWLERSLGVVVVLLRDRDYQALTDVEKLWLDPDEKSLAWRFHEIENYLLEPWVLDATMSEYRKSTWARNLPPDESAIETILQSLAPRLFNDHIGRTLCETLRQHKKSLGSTELNAPKIDPLAGTVAQWQSAIQQKISELHATCQSIVADSEFQPANVISLWSRFESQVRDPTFLTSGDYCRDLKGKRLLNLFWQHLRTQCGFRGNEEDFTNDLVKTIRANYDTNPGFVFRDFEELAGRIRTILATP